MQNCKYKHQEAKQKTEQFGNLENGSVGTVQAYKKDSRYHIPSHMLYLYTGTVYLQYIYSVYMCVYMYMYVDLPYLYKELHVQ